MLAEWAHHCGLAFASHKNIMLTLFAGGLVGSFSHCAGMCGPFVLSQLTARLDAEPAVPLTEWRRLRGAALLPYHAGRITTYSLLGVAAATFAAPLKAQPWFHALAFTLLVAAALLFLGQALRQLQPLLRRFAVWRLPVPVLPAAIQRWQARLFAAPTGWRGYALGLTLGLLPCGLIYAALLVVAAQADPLLALFGMLAFGLGTVPALVLVGIGGQYVTARWRALLRYGAPIVMGANALVLFMVAGGYWK